MQYTIEELKKISIYYKRNIYNIKPLAPSVPPHIKEKYDRIAILNRKAEELIKKDLEKL